MTDIQNTLSAMAKDLYEVGAIDKTTLRQFDPHSLPPVPHYTAKQITAIRQTLGLSQSVFAAYLNVSDRAVKKWEQGEAKPTGATLKLLSIVERKGLDVIAL
ncbi:helix-turn-helix domain-containing protein [Methylovulum psychrotolerans]|uniref:Transcriptional regulator n=1 Tax=Methylovulum psychrotolerans TaxID=1704499 RepID=A0A1Z4C3N7_9GAMM|nr:DNA-binding transcriptional regulator [Methylovulum psychrotolerans]ASF48125.1 transcriptional regulator [Methylovulum psychrotolerans]